MVQSQVLTRPYSSETAIAEQFNSSPNPEQQASMMSKLSDRDPLTGAMNRDALMIYLEDEMRQDCLAVEKPWLMCVDLDNFKHFNSHNGFDLGDELLKRCVLLIEPLLDRQDRMFRIGSNCFVIAMDEATSAEAQLLAQQICTIARTTLSPPQPLKCSDPGCLGPAKISVSIGVTPLQRSMSPVSALRHAEEAMEAAKRSGRDQICLLEV